jgi:hypothetical protein
MIIIGNYIKNPNAVLYSYPCVRCKYIFVDLLFKTIICIKKEEKSFEYSGNYLYTCSDFHEPCEYCKPFFRIMLKGE